MMNSDVISLEEENFRAAAHGDAKDAASNECWGYEAIRPHPQLSHVSQSRSG